MSPMDELKFPPQFPPINITKHMTSPHYYLHQRIQEGKSPKVEPTFPTPKLQKFTPDKKDNLYMPKMRGQVTDSPVKPRTKENFNKAGATKLQV
jgi:hypothetical protein